MYPQFLRFQRHKKSLNSTQMFFFYHVKWNFQWNWREVVTDQSSTHCLAQYFHHPLVSELKYDVGTNQHVLFQSLCKAANQNQWPVWEMGVCSDSNWIAQQIKMAAGKSLETMSNMILNLMQTKFALLCSPIGCEWNEPEIFESNAVTSTDRKGFNFWF